ncbi:hypothetical protein SUGI_0572930 [Cryptomeria japonica]|nr:hypothetical protein SUGI_0572930 [Cryptomeria japonica]
MEGMEGCLAMIPSSLNKVATTHTPEFLGLSSSSSSSLGLWSQYSTRGEDIIVCVIDSGIWPESKSFNDAGLGPVPSRWKGTWMPMVTAYMWPQLPRELRKRVPIPSVSPTEWPEDVPFHINHVAIAAFGAIEKGVFVSAIAGNDGPSLSNLSHTAPWITTVGASSIDRDFPASLVLGNQEIYRGTSDFKGGDGKLQGPFPLVYLINPDDSSAREKAKEVARAGGAGMVVANEELLGAQQLFPYILLFPAITVIFKAGEGIKSYINSTSSNTTATATMRLTGLTIVVDTAAAPIVAAFSSRGPSEAYPSVLKPDMLAPGVNILAAYARGVDYFFNSGTSMAFRHVSGIAALIKAIHPTWSPAAIKSALMTTSYIVDNRKRAIRDSVSMEAADSFGMGSGHVDPRSAMDPGLVYDMAPQDYIDFLCSLNYTRRQIALLTKKTVSCPNSSLEARDLNYPSFSVVFKPGNKSIKVSRKRVTIVGAEGNVVYRVSVKSPPGVNISVEPQTLMFKKLYDLKAIEEAHLHLRVSYMILERYVGLVLMGEHKLFVVRLHSPGKLQIDPTLPCYAICIANSALLQHPRSTLPNFFRLLCYQTNLYLIIYLFSLA